MTKGYIYITIELAHRELDSKSIVAERLLAAGFTVVLGQQWAIFKNLEKLPLGAILFKGYSKIYWPAMLRAKELGFAVFSHEEEVFMQFSDDVQREIVEGLSPHSYDAIFTSGKKETQLLTSVNVEKLVETGNPRIELLGPLARVYYDKDIARIKSKYGDFYLINSNFGVTNSLWEDREKVISASRQAGLSGTISSMVENTILRETRAWNFIKDFIDRDLKKNTFVIRPHPSENMQKWLECYSNYPNVHVERSGHHVPWTLASTALIHSGCVTGLEAIFLGTPAYNIMPDSASAISPSEETDFFSVPVYSLEELKIALETGIRVDKSTIPRLSELAYGWNSQRAPSEIIAESLARRAARTRPLDADEFPSVQFGDPVPQLKKKCQIPEFELLAALKKAQNMLRTATDHKVFELSESLFLIKNRYRVSGKPTLPIINLFEDESGRPQMASSGYFHWRRTVSQRDALTLAEQYWTEAKFKQSLEVLIKAREYHVTNQTINAALGNKLLWLGFEKTAQKVFDNALSVMPNDISLLSGGAKSHLASHPEISEKLILHAMDIVSNNMILKARTYNETLETFGFARRSLAGLPPHHALDLAEIGFFNVHSQAKEFKETLKSAWKQAEIRNINTYLLAAVSQFAYSGLSRLAQFLPTLGQTYSNTVWASVRHWDSESVWYSKLANTFPGKDRLTIISSVLPTLTYSILISCDYVYLQKFGITLLNSLSKVNNKIHVYVHVMVASDKECSETRNALEKCSVLYSLILEDVANIDKSMRRTYFHLARFFRAHELLVKYSQNIWIMDVDALFKNDPHELFLKIENCDVAFRARSCRLAPWNQLNASVVGFSKDKLGRDYLTIVTSYLFNAWTSGLARWGVDQVAMYMVLEYLKSISCAPKVSLLNEREVDYDYQADGVIWQNSGAGKFYNKNDLEEFLDEELKISVYETYFNSINDA